MSHVFNIYANQSQEIINQLQNKVYLLGGLSQQQIFRDHLEDQIKKQNL